MATQTGLNSPCSIAATLDVIGDRWTILILRDAIRGVRRFDHLAADLGIARNLLSTRLARLVGHDILDKEPYQEHPVRYEYRLTDKGRDLSPVLVALMHWGDKHTGEPNNVPLVLAHSACGGPIEQHFVCWECDTTVLPAELRRRQSADQPDFSNIKGL